MTTLIKGNVSQNKYPLATSKLQLASIGLFLECTFSALKWIFFYAHMGYISPFYRLRFRWAQLRENTTIDAGFHEQISHLSCSIFLKKLIARIPIALNYEVNRRWIKLPQKNTLNLSQADISQFFYNACYPAVFSVVTQRSSCVTTLKAAV